MTLWQVAAELARAGNRGALATVVRTTGSTPVPVGTKMLIGPAGRLEGSVGGGCVEADILEAALAAHGSGPLIRTHHLNADIAGDLGLSCGGTVDIVVEPLVRDPGYVQALEAAAAAEQGVVTTALDWSHGPQKHFTPGPVGAAQAPAALSEDRQTMVERLLRPPRIVVFGAGHVGGAIAAAAAAAGFHVAIVDDRAEFADRRRFPDAVTVVVAPLTGAAAQLAIGERDAVVIATRGHRQDAVILEQVAGSPATYVGLLGSRRKKAVVTKALREAGVPAEALARVRVPVGLPIGAETPEEIAVSVVAELIAWRRRSSAADRETAP